MFLYRNVTSFICFLEVFGQTCKGHNTGVVGTTFLNGLYNLLRPRTVTFGTTFTTLQRNFGPTHCTWGFVMVVFTICGVGQVFGQRTFRRPFFLYGPFVRFQFEQSIKVVVGRNSFGVFVGVFGTYTQAQHATYVGWGEKRGLLSLVVFSG